jgi:2-keto-4-pentenoate hydratase/2-oxohepta-3-ene-1,7-dioic acid hydratase in catechol pathway
MRVARFTIDDKPEYGVVQGEEGTEVVHAIGGDPLFTDVTPTGRTYPLEDVRLLAPVIPRSKVIGVARSYANPAVPEHPEALAAARKVAARAAAGEEMGPGDLAALAHLPRTFTKPNTSVVGPGDPIVLPADVKVPATEEAELAVVIGRIGKDVPVERVPDLVFGYTVANDVGLRYPPGVDDQWVRAKALDSFCPLGPWIETDLRPEDGLAVRAWVDGQLVQEGTTADLLLSIPELIADLSHVFTLLPGDVILTGTPLPAGFIAAGNRVTCEVEGIGTLTNPVVSR